MLAGGATALVALLFFRACQGVPGKGGKGFWGCNIWHSSHHLPEEDSEEASAIGAGLKVVETSRPQPLKKDTSQLPLEDP